MFKQTCGMKTVKFSEKVIINCRPEEVFDYTQDYGARLQWDTFLKQAELLDGAVQANKGVRAYCVAQNGFGMTTEYVSFNRPKATAIKMTKGPWIFRSFLGSWTFKEWGSSQTEVIFLYAFNLRFPFNLGTPFIKNKLKANVRQRLSDLKKSLEGRSNTLS
jgi:ribosome-associated toxin RatA of RatAB toxin-antitoxin module